MLENEHDRGMICAVSAFFLWGFLPIYWKTLAPTTALEVIAHRIVWSFVFTWAILLWQPPAEGWRSILRQRQRLIGLLFSALLLVGNWLSYVMAVQQDRVLEVSLGYFIVPLLNILFGFLFLRGRFSSWQWLAIGLTALALINLMRQAEQFPWLQGWQQKSIFQAGGDIVDVMLQIREDSGYCKYAWTARVVIDKLMTDNG